MRTCACGSAGLEGGFFFFLLVFVCVCVYVRVCGCVCMRVCTRARAQVCVRVLYVCVVLRLCVLLDQGLRKVTNH